MAFSEKNIVNIMSCDGYICADSPAIDESKIVEDINKAVIYLYNFEQRFSRFLENNELFEFNQSTAENIEVSDELLEMISLSKKYNEETNGIFDITILNSLLEEGYVKSKHLGFVDNKKEINTKSPENTKIDIAKLTVNAATKTVSKPNELKIDLGGIGKSYAIGKIAEEFDQKYQNFCISLGGDIKLKGKDNKNKYDYWAIEVENPLEPKLCVATLMIKDEAIATSGINRRNWLKNGKKKNHIIDPKSNKSVENDLLAVTVIDADIVKADVLAKTILIMGKNNGLKYCEAQNIPALIIDKKLNIDFSSKINPYVWKK